MAFSWLLTQTPQCRAHCTCPSIISSRPKKLQVLCDAHTADFSSNLTGSVWFVDISHRKSRCTQTISFQKTVQTELAVVCCTYGGQDGVMMNWKSAESKLGITSTLCDVACICKRILSIFTLHIQYVVAKELVWPKVTILPLLWYSHYIRQNCSQ